MESIEEIKIVNNLHDDAYITINSNGIIGITAYPVEIETFISSGLPCFTLVGLPDTAVNESRERVKAAIKSCGFDFPSKKITVNLAPADTKKAGPNYDLSIALGILACIENIENKSILDKESLKGLYIVGELGLSGKIRRINGVLSSVILAKSKNAKGIIIPRENENEASLISGIKIYPASTLQEAIEIINNLENIEPLARRERITITGMTEKLDLIDVKGQEKAKRALEIVASGGHNLLMIGSPGSGKTMLAERLKTILPPLNNNEKIEITQIYSSIGKLEDNKGLIDERPFRAPHSSISAPGLIGGGSIPTPGEITLAHNGVLFLDEFTEFQRSVIESLRQAIENKKITISRSTKSLSFPCNFTLIAACNPCPCGYLGDKYKNCKCNLNLIERYRSKLSGPILDRIDLQVEVKRLSNSELLGRGNTGTSSKEIKKTIMKAHEIQKERGSSNALLSSKQMKKYCELDQTCLALISEATKKHMLTGRSFDRVLKVSRTIADIESSGNIKEEHLLEALQFRIN